MIVHVTLLARSIVTKFTIKFEACFGLKKVAKHCYIKQPEKNVQFLTLFFEKLCSQNFLTLNRNLEHYAHKVVFFVDFQAIP
jgi:hypothetical protein